jgi:hypothetical protein
MPQDQSKPLRIFSVVHKTNPDTHACLSDDAEHIAIFMWGRMFNNYQLYVNNREYGWCNVAGLKEIEIHLRSCREMDEVLYEYD